MFRPLFWTIIRSQLNLRKLYGVIYKILDIYNLFYKLHCTVSSNSVMT